jgi:MFS family permease
MKRLRILHPLRERDFALFQTGSTVSLIGDGLFMVAIAWQVYDIWNVPTAFAIVGVAETVPLVALLLFSGVLIDRVERRWVMFWACLVRGACVGAIGLLAVSGALELWHVFVIAVFYGAGRAFEGPASGAMVPDLVPTHLLVQANSLNGVVRPLAQRLVGPALGGLIVHELGAGTAFLLDAATFGVAALMLTQLRPRLAAIQREQHPSVREDIVEGLRFVRKHTWLWGTIVWALFAAMLGNGPFVVLVPYIVKNELGGGADDLGYVFASGGVGAVLAAIVMGQRGLPRKHIRFMYLVWGLSMLALAGYGLAQELWHAMVANFIGAGAFTAGLIVWSTLMHKLVPTELLGRVSSFDWFVSVSLIPVSFAITGPIAAAIGPEATLIAAGVVGAPLTLAFLFLPGMRDVEGVSQRQ